MAACRHCCSLLALPNAHASAVRARVHALGRARWCARAGRRVRLRLHLLLHEIALRHFAAVLVQARWRGQMHGQRGVRARNGGAGAHTSGAGAPSAAPGRPHLGTGCSPCAASLYSPRHEEMTY